jgi:diguanylate cyclase (GGDEF)-like protein
MYGQSGARLGSIHAACDPAAQKKGSQTNALEMGARLAVLAIETHRLYADLTYRSEFDALTDVPNRFSLDRQLQEQVQKARENATVVGLIYADLDDFKQVNDEYGHQVGDVYLQETAARIKTLLRPGDVLARLGGDEFAILVPNARSRWVVEEIARRLSASFRTPLMIEGEAFTGSASIGVAMYPEDGTTSDALLRAADSAMYQNKKARDSARSVG